MGNNVSNTQKKNKQTKRGHLLFISYGIYLLINVTMSRFGLKFLVWVGMTKDILTVEYGLYRLESMV